MTTSTLEIDLPVVANIEEAAKWAKDFKSILTVGPDRREVNWNHPNHRVYTFRDITYGKDAPSIHHIESAIEWGQNQEDLLVHCHAGMSRSTATAWGISIARGADPLESFLLLKDAQPVESDPRWGIKEPYQREFIPNRLIVTYLEKIFGIYNLLEIRNTHQSIWYA